MEGVDVISELRNGIEAEVRHGLGDPWASRYACGDAPLRAERHAGAAV
jgi:hypothetical protein